MSYEDVESCRLCSGEKNLISMFSGKARKMRDFIRKMIEELVHIKIEQYDPFPSVCYNCSVDVSNFYFFKLNILQKQKELKGQSPVSKAKRLKLQSINLKDVVRPDMKEAETVLNWLESKRIGLENNKLEHKDTQTFQIHCDVALQCEVVETNFKECQTSNPKLKDSASQCDRINPHLPSKMSVKSRSSQTWSSSKETKSSECAKKSRNRHTQTKTTSCYEKSSQADIKVVSTLCRIENTLKPDFIKGLEDSCCQTDIMNVTDKGSQTEQRKLTQNLFHNSVGTEVCTQDGFAQTDVFSLVNLHTQGDILALNSFQNSILQTKAKVDSRESKNSYKIADPQTFTDALLNGFDNIFMSKTTQTETSGSRYDHFNFSDSYFTTKESYRLSPIGNSPFTEDESKLDIKVNFADKFKEEKRSPSETLTVSTGQSPENNGLLSPQSSELLQVNNNKTDQVKICKLCDKTLYSKTEVVKHNKTHMQCNICRRRFRSLKATQSHINDCKVKQISNSPFVDLVRIDQMSEIREKYFKPLEH